MKSKTILAVAVAALFSYPAIAQDVKEVKGAHGGPVPTADMITGGYQGWGPMANPVVPGMLDSAEGQRARARHLAEVNQARDQVWAQNAPLREPYMSRENLAAYIGNQQTTAVGATRSEGGGFLRFFRRDDKKAID